jgi:hypothetical protein
MTLHFRAGQFAEAADLVIKHHYSRRIPSNVQLVGTMHEAGGLFGDYGRAVGAVFFSIPPTRWSEPVWELSRLVRADEKIALTAMIAKACDLARKHGADLLVSFADWTQRHHGGVYQAASWNYDGCRDRRMDGVMVDGAFIPGRSANSRWGTQSPAKLSSMLGKEVLPHFDEGKHLYWRALNRAGRSKAARLGLKSMPYLKPDQAAKGMEG